MTEQAPEEQDARFQRDRREHGGAPDRLDDDQLARLAEEERVEAGLDDYDPDEVPAATDAPSAVDITQTPGYQEQRDEIQREVAEGDLRPGNAPDPYPPTHYDEP
jgi:hypothetical protein